MKDGSRNSFEQNGSKKLAAQPSDLGGRNGDPVARLVRRINASHEVLKDLWSRVRRAADIALRSKHAAAEADKIADAKRMEHHVIQSEHPRRRAPLPRQRTIAAIAVGLDAIACYYAAQALNGDQITTLIWTGFFLAVLAGGEIFLDIYRERNSRVWRLTCIALCGFVAGLGTLRYSFLFVTGDGGMLAALAGASVFTVVTGVFLLVGYRALRAAETPAAWRARRQARKASRRAATAHVEAADDMADFDRLADNYIGEARHLLLEAFPTSEQPDVEAALRAHLLGMS